MFEHIIMQAVNGSAIVVPQGADPNLAATLQALGILGAIASGIIGFLKSKQAKEFADVAGKVATAGLQKGTEAKAAVLKLAPEDKQELLKSLTEEVKKGMEQVNTIKAQKPTFDPEKMQMPRESFDTRPVQKRVEERGGPTE
jgi:hypothetical protein